MPRAKRGVRFPHKANNGHASEGRRSSFSDFSEEGSSPTKPRSSSSQLQQQALGDIKEVRLQSLNEDCDILLSFLPFLFLFFPFFFFFLLSSLFTRLARLGPKMFQC